MEIDSPNNSDKATEVYWEDLWRKDEKLPQAVDPHHLKFAEHHIRIIHYQMAESFGACNGRSILEIGCAQSAWLTYFDRQFGLRVFGLDYSESGCEKTRQMLLRDQVEGEIQCCDMFNPPMHYKNRFDFVVSYGVLEHFEDTAETLKTLSEYVAPGGKLLTFIPNMAGLIGLAQKTLNRPVYDIHVPIDRETLRNAHDSIGLEVLKCKYCGPTNFDVMNLHGVERRGPQWWIRRSAQLSLRAFTWGTWAIEACGVTLPTSRALSPYVFSEAIVGRQ